MQPARDTTTPDPASLEGAFAPVEEAIEEVRAGRMVVVCDSADRENEGDLVLAAELATPEAVNFMARHGRGLICLALTPERCDRLGLELMPQRNSAPFGTAFTVSIRAARGTGADASAHGRARTIRVAADPASGPADLLRPGHVSPLRARRGGVLERPGHTEAGVDLARAAGLAPAGVVCEVMNEDGSMARVGDLIPYCREHGLKLVTIADLIAHRWRTERLIERVSSMALPTSLASFEVIGYRSLLDGSGHMAVATGEVAGVEALPVRVQPGCPADHAEQPSGCDCRERLDGAMRAIAAEGRGVVVSLARDVAGIGAQVLADLGVSSVRLLSDDPVEVEALAACGVEVVERTPIEAPIEVDWDAELAEILATGRWSRDVGYN